MQALKKILRFLAEYFVVFVGLLFVFAIGGLYAFIRPQGIVFSLVALAIVVGWVVFLIKYFWDLMEKKNPPETS